MKRLFICALFLTSFSAAAALNCVGVYDSETEDKRVSLVKSYQSGEEINYQMKLKGITFYASHYTKLDDLYMVLVDNATQLTSKFVRTISPQGHDLEWSDGDLTLNLNCKRPHEE